MTGPFWRAVLLGFSVAAPVGPIGILCIRRTLADGRLVGLATGLGAATADTLYGLVAGLGLSATASSLSRFELPLRLVGGVYLAYLGVTTFRAHPAERAAEARGGAAWRAWASTFGLTITNPMTVIAFAAMFGAIAGPDLAAGPGRAGVLAGGVLVGASAWWLLLSAVADRLRHRLEPRHLRWVNRASGVLLLAFAAWALAAA